ncbi:prolyl-tRNA editing enzyme YbaK/EbsC (Cys-tRNA(Pro) deacylase) [Microbacteriaceae bacterium MWH-Ta3]|nr:prolyl-tRNA editing enzyme YbaK/EbsC (Cys-tRNA(Pro) deacylase) [Microbacteriaceae bacterium MWH-Ta3]
MAYRAVTELHPNGQRVHAALIAADVAGRIVETIEPSPTAVAAAEQLGIEVGQIANSLIFDADGEPVLVMTSGAHRVDTDALARTLGVNSVRRPDADFVRRATGQPIGGVAPVGHPAPLRTIVDTHLATWDEVWAAGGHPHYVFPTSFAELVRITAGTPMPVGVGQVSAD